MARTTRSIIHPRVEIAEQDMMSEWSSSNPYNQLSGRIRQITIGPSCTVTESKNHFGIGIVRHDSEMFDYEIKQVSAERRSSQSSGKSLIKPPVLILLKATKSQVQDSYDDTSSDDNMSQQDWTRHNNIPGSLLQQCIAFLNKTICGDPGFRNPSYPEVNKLKGTKSQAQYSYDRDDSCAEKINYIFSRDFFDVDYPLRKPSVPSPKLEFSLKQPSVDGNKLQQGFRITGSLLQQCRASLRETKCGDSSFRNPSCPEDQDDSCAEEINYIFPPNFFDVDYPLRKPPVPSPKLEKTAETEPQFSLKQTSVDVNKSQQGFRITGSLLQQCRASLMETKCGDPSFRNPSYPEDQDDSCAEEINYIFPPNFFDVDYPLRKPPVPSPKLEKTAETEPQFSLKQSSVDANKSQQEFRSLLQQRRASLRKTKCGDPSFRYPSYPEDQDDSCAEEINYIFPPNFFDVDYPLRKPPVPSPKLEKTAETEPQFSLKQTSVDVNKSQQGFRITGSLLQQCRASLRKTKCGDPSFRNPSYPEDQDDSCAEEINYIFPPNFFDVDYPLRKPPVPSPKLEKTAETEPQFSLKQTSVDVNKSQHEFRSLLQQRRASLRKTKCGDPSFRYPSYPEVNTLEVTSGGLPMAYPDIKPSDGLVGQGKVAAYPGSHGTGQGINIFNFYGTNPGGAGAHKRHMSQEQDTGGELETKMYKGNVVPTCGGGALFNFNDVEMLEQTSPDGPKKRFKGKEQATDDELETKMYE